MGYRKREGWTLVELAIVVTIIGILAALAIPVFKLILLRSRLSGLAIDLRTHSEAFHRYAMETGEYPPSFGYSISTEMKGFLSATWQEPTPVGGRFHWVRTQGSGPNNDIYIQIIETSGSEFAIGLSDIVKLDDKIDDGNLGTGYLQVAGSRIRYYLQL